MFDGGFIILDYVLSMFDTSKPLFGSSVRVSHIRYNSLAKSVI